MPPVPRVKVNPNGGFCRDTFDRGEDGWRARLCQALGTTSYAFASHVFEQLSVGPRDQTPEETAERINTGLAFIAHQKPRNEIETAILVQFWITHLAAVSQTQFASRADLIPKLEAHGGMAVKFGNLAVRQIEALAKLRGGGKQEVTVTHVHQHVYVADGGQAVVGNVTGGGGGDPRNLTQSHAPALGHAIGPEVRRENPERQALPRAGHSRQGAVSDARRPGRRSKGRKERRVAPWSPDGGDESGPPATRRDE